MAKTQYKSSEKAVRWYSAEEGEVHKQIFRELANIEQASSQRWEMWRRYDQIYGDPWWFQPNTSLRTIPEMEVQGNGKRLRVNKVRSLVETYSSRLGSSRVLPMAVPKGGNPDLQEKTKLNNRLIEGTFEADNVYDRDAQWNRDLARYGTMIGYFDEDGEDPVVMRPDPYSIYINDSEWENGVGHTIHWLRPRPKDLLIDEFPDFEAEILKASSAQFNHATRYLQPDVENGMVPCFYSWAKPMGSIPGRKCIVIRGATLFDEEWDDDLPFAFGSRTPPTHGPWGEPLMADLAPLQETHDRYMMRVDESLWLANVLRLIIRRNAKFNKSKIRNIPGTIYETDDPEKDIRSVNWEISGQLLEYIRYVEQQMQELSRSNPMQTIGENQPSDRSFRSKQLAANITDQGLREPLRSRDSFYKRAAELLIKAFDRLGTYKMLLKLGKTAQEISYRKIRLPKDSYVWTVMPTDFKDKTVEGRMNQADWLVDRGIIPESETARYVDFTDMESISDMAMAQNDAIMHRINRIRVDGEYIPPHPMLNLVLLRKMVGDAYCRGEADGLEEDKLQMLKDLLVEAENIQATAEAAAEAAAKAKQAPAAVPAPLAAATAANTPAAATPTPVVDPSALAALSGAGGAPLGAMQGTVPPVTEAPPPAPPAPVG